MGGLSLGTPHSPGRGPGAGRFAGWCHRGGVTGATPEKGPQRAGWRAWAGWSGGCSVAHLGEGTSLIGGSGWCTEPAIPHSRAAYCGWGRWSGHTGRVTSQANLAAARFHWAGVAGYGLGAQPSAQCWEGGGRGLKDLKIPPTTLCWLLEGALCHNSVLETMDPPFVPTHSKYM